MRIDVRFEDPGISRIGVSELNGETVLTIPPVRSVCVMLFLPAWLAGWTVGGVTAYQQFMSATHGRAFLGFWLCGWLLGELFAAGTLLWLIFGKETVKVSLVSLTHTYRVLLWSRSRSYLPASIKNLRWQPGSGYGRYGTQSCVSFEYGAKTVSMARGCDAGEGNAIVGAIAKRIGERSRAQS